MDVCNPWVQTISNNLPICIRRHDPTPWVQRNRRALRGTDSPSNPTVTPRTLHWGFAIAVAPGAATLSHFAGLSAKAEEWHLQQSNGYGMLWAFLEQLRHPKPSCIILLSCLLHQTQQMIPNEIRCFCGNLHMSPQMGDCRLLWKCLEHLELCST